MNGKRKKLRGAERDELLIRMDERLKNIAEKIVTQDVLNTNQESRIRSLENSRNLQAGVVAGVIFTFKDDIINKIRGLF